MATNDQHGPKDPMGRMDQFSRDTPQEGHFLAAIPTTEEEEAAQGHQGSLGQRVRASREEKGLSMAELARSGGLSEQELSDIEADRSNPPLGVLIKLGKALGMRFGSLISAGKTRDYVVTRQGDLNSASRVSDPRQTSYGYTYHSLAAGKKNRAMEPFLITLREPQNEVLAAAHGGEEFIFVLEGEMEAVIKGTVERLGPGDSIYYDSTVPHLVRPAGSAPARILAVLVSPRDSGA